MPLPKRKKNERQAELAGGKRPADREEVCLVAALDSGGVMVEDAGGELGGGVIKNVAVLTLGTAYPLGREPFDVDSTMLTQVVESVNDERGGVKCRITHPEMQRSAAGGYVDGILWLVGRVKDARLADGQVRADVHVGSYADDSPNGKLGTYLRGLARATPTDIGMSIRAYMWFEDNSDGLPLGRVALVSAVDFVETAGGNPNGLLAGASITPGPDAASSRRRHGETPMKLNAKQRAFLASVGLVKKANAEQVEEFLAGLTAEQKTFLDSLADVAADPPADPPPTNLAGTQPPPVSDADKQRIGTEALAADRKRREEIIALAAEHKMPADWARGMADRGASVADVRNLIEMAGAVPLMAAGANVQAGADRNLSSLAPAMEDALCLRAGVGLFEMAGGSLVLDANRKPIARKPHERANRFRSLSVADLARQHLKHVGVPDTEMLGRDQVLAVALDSRRMIDAGVPVGLAMSTSDFAHVLGNTVNRSLQAAYALAPVTWPAFCQRTTNPDFKARAITAISEAPSLLLTEEGGEVRYAKFLDRGRSVQVVKFSRGVRWTREAMVNDDLGALDQGRNSFGPRAKAKEDDVVYALLNANAAIDGGNLFNSTAITVAGGHANLATVAGAPSVATLDAAYAAMGLQRGMQTVQEGDDGAAFLNLTPTVMLVPFAHRGTADALINMADPQNPNRYKGRLSVIANARLDAASATAWYLLAPTTPPAEITGAPMGVDTIAVAFLESQQEPVTRQEQDFATLDIKIACEHIVTAAVVDWRGMYRNAGA